MTTHNNTVRRVWNRNNTKGFVQSLSLILSLSTLYIDLRLPVGFIRVSSRFALSLLPPERPRIDEKNPINVSIKNPIIRRKENERKKSNGIRVTEEKAEKPDRKAEKEDNRYWNMIDISSEDRGVLYGTKRLFRFGVISSRA